MFHLTLPLLLLATCVRSVDIRSTIPRLIYSAASPAQIRFALENKYDDTGPGAKSPEYGYNTYKTLDEALVGYIDDPDTQLPEREKENAIRKLYGFTKSYHKYHGRPHPNLAETEYSAFKMFRNAPESKKISDGDPRVTVDLSQLKANTVESKKLHNYGVDPFRWQKVKPMKASPLSIAHYTREPDSEDFDPNPQYQYSYGVHDAATGDSKAAQESRDGDMVLGYYTLTDPDGKRRTVHYQADDKLGFRATVHRIFH